MNEEPRFELDFDAVSFDEWREKLSADMKGADFARLVTMTLEGIELQPLYTAADSDPQPIVGRATSGWDIRQPFGHPDPAVVARRIADELTRGVTSIWLTAPIVDGASLKQMLAPVDLDRTHLSLGGGPQCAAEAALVCAHLEHRGVKSPSIHLNIDMIGAVAATGARSMSVEQSKELAASAATWCAKRPGMRALGVSTQPYHDAGASAVQEVSFAVATGLRYLALLMERGMDIAEASGQLAFTVSIGSEFFTEVAKLRALRQCWARVVEACGGAESDQTAVIHGVTSWRNKTARDPWVNLLRETTEAFSAAIGGADAISTRGFAATLGESDDFARRMARNAQVILNEESHLTHVDDPGRGSWYVEALTGEIAKAAWKGFQHIESLGGMGAALAKGEVATMIEGTAQERNRRIAKRKFTITGVSEFAHLGEEAPVCDVLEPAPAAPATDVPKLDPAGPFESLVAAAKAGATVASLTASLSDGTDWKGTAMPRVRDAAPFEALRDASDAHRDRTGSRPRAFLCNLGPPALHRARAGFATGLCNAVGLEVIDNEGFPAAEAAGEAMGASGTSIAVICGSDDQYAEMAAAAAKALTAAGATQVWLAGRPGDGESAYRQAGVTDFMFVGINVLDAGTRLHAAMEVGP